MDKRRRLIKARFEHAYDRLAMFLTSELNEIETREGLGNIGHAELAQRMLDAVVYNGEPVLLQNLAPFGGLRWWYDDPGQTDEEKWVTYYRQGDEHNNNVLVIRIPVRGGYFHLVTNLRLKHEVQQMVFPDPPDPEQAPPEGDKFRWRLWHPWRVLARYRCHGSPWCCQYQDSPMCNTWTDPHLVARMRFRHRERKYNE